MSEFTTISKTSLGGSTVRIVKRSTDSHFYFVFKAKSDTSTMENDMNDLKSLVDEASSTKSMYILIVNLLLLNSLPFDAVLKWVDFFQSKGSFLKKSVLYTAFVSENPNLHIGIRMGLKLFPPIKPFIILPTLAEAYSLKTLRTTVMDSDKKPSPMCNESDCVSVDRA